jgi:hypothetical protein
MTRSRYGLDISFPLRDAEKLAQMLLGEAELPVPLAGPAPSGTDNDNCVPIYDYAVFEKALKAPFGVPPMILGDHDNMYEMPPRIFENPRYARASYDRHPITKTAFPEPAWQEHPVDIPIVSQDALIYHQVTGRSIRDYGIWSYASWRMEYMATGMSWPLENMLKQVTPETWSNLLDGDPVKAKPTKVRYWYDHDGRPHPKPDRPDVITRTVVAIDKLDTGIKICIGIWACVILLLLVALL